jgi:hypothetical protein
MARKGRAGLVVAGWALAVAGMSGCGGDVCDASISSLEGEWTLTWNNDGDVVEFVIEIDGEGNVDYRDSDGGRAECDIENELVCEAKVECTKNNGDIITFDLSKDDE